MSRDHLWYAAVHEAGHVVTGLALSFPIAWVSIDPSVCTGEPSDWAREAWTKVSGNHGMLVYAEGAFQANCNDLIRPLVEAGELRTQADRDLIRRYVAMFVAGGMIERTFGGTPPPDSATGDAYQISRVVSAVVKSKHQHDAIMRHAIRRVGEITVRHRYAIKALADALVERGTLYGPEIIEAAGLHTIRSGRSDADLALQAPGDRERHHTSPAASPGLHTLP